MKKLLIATHNPAKAEEIRKFLSDLPIELVTLSDVGIAEDIEETGKTLEENAILKATTYAKQSGLPSIADDGGLEIDFLNGEPGVKSKRWIGGVETSDEELIAYTFKQMEGVPMEKRGAQMRLVVALAIPPVVRISNPLKEGRLISGTTVYTSEGIVRGIIAEKPSSSPIKKGFPFRQIMYIPQLGKYYNQEEMTEMEEERYNHRRQAIERLKKTLHNFY